MSSHWPSPLRSRAWTRSDRTGRCQRPAEPGQRSSHCYSGPGRATGCPNTGAIRRRLGRVDLPPPLTATVPLGRDSSSSRPKRYVRWRAVQVEYLRPRPPTQRSAAVRNSATCLAATTRPSSHPSHDLDRRQLQLRKASPADPVHRPLLVEADWVLPSVSLG
jgi:hypothetical protein